MNLTMTELEGKQLSYIEKSCDEPVWSLIPLYNSNPSGGLLMWQVGFDSETNELSILHGLIDSKNKQLKKRQIVLNNSGRTYQEQGLLEARSRYHKMYQKGYRPANINMESNGINKLSITPMLASPYKRGEYNEKTKKTSKS